MAIEKMKNSPDGTIEINLRFEAEFPSHGYDEIVLATFVAKAVERTPAFEKYAADQGRQLRRQIAHFFLWQPVPERVQDRLQQSIGARDIPVQFAGDFIDPMLRLLR